MEITFERQALYEEVWSTPLTQLAKKYGLSDNGLRNVCKAMSIPLPIQGHWAKVAAGHTVPKTPLPAQAERNSFVSRPPETAEEFSDPADAAWLDQRIVFETDPANRIAFDPSPARWNPVIAPMRDDLRQAAAEALKMKRDAEAASKRPARGTGPNFNAGQWKWFERDGQILNRTHRRTPLRVSPLTYERALAVLDALAKAARLRGFQVSLDDKEGRIVLQGFGEKVEVRMSERLADDWRTEIGWDKKAEKVRYRVPTGELRLYIGDVLHERQFRDGATQKLEDQLNDVFLFACRHVVHERNLRREREDQHRRYEEQQRARAEAERRARELQAGKAKLLDDARAWQTATLIREYVAHLEAAGTDVEAEWLAWAREHADSLDPLKRR